VLGTENDGALPTVLAAAATTAVAAATAAADGLLRCGDAADVLSVPASVCQCT
jgi:hypothetical protein